jgi:hypothetical protein
MVCFVFRGLLVEEHFGDRYETLYNACNSHQEGRNLLGKCLTAATSLIKCLITSKYIQYNYKHNKFHHIVNTKLLSSLQVILWVETLTSAQVFDCLLNSLFLNFT